MSAPEMIEVIGQLNVKQMGIIGLDIDGVITAYPEVFSELARTVSAAGGKVHVVSSRSPSAEQETRAELRSLSVSFDCLFLLPNFGHPIDRCPHRDLSWYEQYLWQKVDYCMTQRIKTFFDDDPKVLRLFARYAGHIRAVKIL